MVTKIAEIRDHISDLSAQVKGYIDHVKTEQSNQMEMATRLIKALRIQGEIDESRRELYSLAADILSPELRDAYLDILKDTNL